MIYFYHHYALKKLCANINIFGEDNNMKNKHSHYALLVWMSLVSAALVFLIVLIVLNLLSVDRISLSEGWGSFAGGLAAAAATITAFLVTNRENRRQFNELTRVNHMPLIDFEPCAADKLDDYKSLGYIEHAPIEINRDLEKKHQNVKTLYLILDNKGNGPARNLSCHYQYYVKEDQLVSQTQPIIIRSMQAGAGMILPLNLYNFNGESNLNFVLNFEDIMQRKLDSGIVRIDFDEEASEWRMYAQKFVGNQ